MEFIGIIILRRKIFCKQEKRELLFDTTFFLLNDIVYIDYNHRSFYQRKFFIIRTISCKKNLISKNYLCFNTFI